MSDKPFPRLNILYSYAFLRGSEKNIGTGGGLRKWVDALSPYVDILMDSGAVTNLNTSFREVKQGRNPDLITLPEYIDYCHSVKDKYWGYISLDEIGNPEGTRFNLSEMAKAGLKPIPVFTYNDDLAGLDELLDINDIIGVGFGGIRARPPKMRATYRMIHKYTEGKIKIHGLGFARYPDVMHLPVFSGDSSTWCSGGRYGVMSWFDKNHGVQSVKYKYMQRDKAGMQRVYSELRNVGYQARFLKDRKYFWKNYGIPATSTAYSYLRLHAAVARKGFKFFFAVPNTTWSITLMSVLGNCDLDGLDYAKLRATKVNLDDMWWKDMDQAIEIMLDFVRTKTRWEEPNDVPTTSIRGDTNIPQA